MRSKLNKQFVRFYILVSVLCVLCASVVNSAAQDYKTLKEGIEYAEVTKEISGLKVNMNLLRLDLTKVRLDVNHAMDAAIGTEKTSSIATRHGAFAAINAGFFRLDNSIWAGDAVGILMIDNRLFSESTNDRIAMGIINELDVTKVQFGHVRTSLKIGPGIDERFKVDGINRERKSSEIVLYTFDFGLNTLTSDIGSEFAVESGDTYPRFGNIAQIQKGKGCTTLSPNRFVISAEGEPAKRLESYFTKRQKLARWIANFETIEPGETHFFRIAEDITNGVPQLIKDGKIDITWEQENATKSFVETRHPRTAVAKLKDGKFLMITVDGRTESSGGIGLQDLAEYLLSLGATDAMNLDGGGSTTMFVDGKVVNHPSDKEGERKVSDAILVTPRTKH